jgi:hypothetical protein
MCAVDAVRPARVARPGLIPVTDAGSPMGDIALAIGMTILGAGLICLAMGIRYAADAYRDSFEEEDHP